MQDDVPTTRKPDSMSDSQRLPSAELRILFAFHAVLTAAAGIVLIIAPDFIPNAVGIRLEPAAYLVCYLLAAAEFGFAVLSVGAMKLTDVKALRLIVSAFLVFHGASGILEIYAFAKGANASLLGNIAVRAVAVFLFAYYGFYKTFDHND